MLTIDDCIALSDLTKKDIDAIAEMERLPTTVAREADALRANSFFAAKPLVLTRPDGTVFRVELDKVRMPSGTTVTMIDVGSFEKALAASRPET